MTDDEAILQKKKTSSSSSSTPFHFQTDILTHQKRGRPLKKRGADALWDFLLEEGAALQSQTSTPPTNSNADTDADADAGASPPLPPPIHAMEVGMHTSGQCLQAAQLGFHVHCIEPSPKSIQRIVTRIDQVPIKIKEFVRFYQMAAADKSGHELEFFSEGGTGDHVNVGGTTMDMLAMEKKTPDDQQQQQQKQTVKSVSIDDIIYNKITPTRQWGRILGSPISSTNTNYNYNYNQKAKNEPMDRLFLLKVDTQGFEPAVFSGLTQALREHKIDYVISEYWPRGIDFMNDMKSTNDMTTEDDECVKPLEIIRTLHDAGYIIYAMANVAHPSAPKGAKHFLNDGRINNIPYNDMMDHCKWFYNVERKFPSEEYKMGYWTDFLAVAPNARLPKTPVTELGDILMKRITKMQ